MRKEREDIPNEEIYELRKQRMTYKAIADYFCKKGAEISLGAVRKRCKKIYKLRGEKEPKAVRINVNDDAIYNLRKQGLTYQEISTHMKKSGIKISWGTVRERCNKIYELRGEKEPKLERIKGISDDDIVKFREQGMTYKAIAESFSKNGIEISLVTVSKRCKGIYESRGKDVPKADKTISINDTIFELREQGMTYREISKHFKDKSIDISTSTIGRKCKYIYGKKGRKEPKVGKKRPDIIKGIEDDKIYELREEGYSYSAIAGHFKARGYKISTTAIGNRCKRIYKSLRTDEPKQLSRRKKRNKPNDDSLKSLNDQLNARIIEKINGEKRIDQLNKGIAEQSKGVEK